MASHLVFLIFLMPKNFMNSFSDLSGKENELRKLKESYPLPPATPICLSLSLVKPFFFPGCLHSCSVVLTLWDCMDCRLPGSSAHGIFQAGKLEWVANSYSRGSSPTRNWTSVSCVSCTGRQILYHWATWEAPFLFPYVWTNSLSPFRILPGAKL